MSEEEKVKKRQPVSADLPGRDRLVTGSNATSTTKKLEIDLDVEEKRNEEER